MVWRMIGFGGEEVRRRTGGVGMSPSGTTTESVGEVGRRTGVSECLPVVQPLSEKKRQRRTLSLNMVPNMCMGVRL